MGSRQEVLARLNAGDATGAARIARDFLTASPDDADVQGLLGLALEEAGDAVGALDALRGAVALRAAPSIALRNTANLAAMLVGAGRKEEAGAVLRSDRPWLADVEIGANEHQCIVLLADIMKGLGLNEELVAFLLPIVARVPHQWAVVRRTAVALSAVGRHEDALALVKGTARLPAEEADRQAVLGYLYGRAGQPEKAGAAAAAFAHHAAPYITARKPGQRFTVGVLNGAPGGEVLLASDRDRHFSGNFPARLANKLAARYRFASLLVGAGPAALAKFREQQARVLINNVVNPEVLLDGRTLAAAQALTAEIGLPVINPPERAALCTRQMNFERFAGTPNMVVPLVKRFNVLPGRVDEMVRLAEQSFAYPVLVRTVTEHESRNIVLATDRPSLREALLGLTTRGQVYLIQYVGATRHKNCYRKIRAAFVEGVPIVIRADYDENWIIKARAYKEKQDFYRDRRDLMEDANDIVSRPHARLGAAAMATIEAIGRTFPLDIFGLDFDIDEAGRVVFFEANAAMNFIWWIGGAEFAYPVSAEVQFLEGVERLLERRAAAGGTVH